MSELSIASSASFVAANYKSLTSAHTTTPILFHIIHIANISKSRLNQKDDWLEYNDPNNVSADRLNKSNKIVREIKMGDDSTPVASVYDVYKLLLRDSHNNYCYGYEVEPLGFLRNSSSQSTGTPLPIRLGGRLIVKSGCLIQQGVLLLRNRQCNYLGIDESETELVSQLNNGIVNKYIDVLDMELKEGS
ncbi:uncharacterized protein RJT20DRAFT_131731 [Scheffersomyces xylosifermentans]|uniref:uncharacterized protein n=1 Tax=Scheffersomyces xylosifermentans TaxID=1304137 RepID=UPI00315CDFBF